MKTHVTSVIGRLRARFEALKADVDASFGPEPVFSGNDRSQVYKAFFKTVVIEDGGLVQPAIALAAEAFPQGGLSQVYPMLHLPKDTSEQGNWHRDDNTNDRQVFWVPISRYDYPALSVVLFRRHSQHAIEPGRPRGVPLLGLERELPIPPDTFFSWSSRFVHRGNLNTSDSIGAALVIFLDHGKRPIASATEPISAQTVRGIGHTLRSALSFDGRGNLAKVDKAAISTLTPRIASNIEGFFKIRTKRELYNCAA